MRDKMTKKQNTERYEYLKSKLAQMESRVPEEPFYEVNKVRLYLSWLKLTPTEKEDLKVRWKRYYKDLENTKTIKEYHEMREMLRKGETVALKEAIAKHNERIESEGWELKKPSSEDPGNITSSQEVKTYLRLKYEKESMDNESRGLEYYAAKELFG